MASPEDYAQAAALLWGEAGEYAAAGYCRLNRGLFGGSLPPLPIVIGLTAYGGCLGSPAALPPGGRSPASLSRPGSSPRAAS